MLTKWGQEVYGNDQQAQWVSRITHAKNSLTNAVLTDTLGDSGMTYIPSSFEL